METEFYNACAAWVCAVPPFEHNTLEGWGTLNLVLNQRVGHPPSGELTEMFDELKTEDQEPEKQKTTDYSGLIIFACTLPVLLFFTHIGKTDMGLSIGICLFVNGVAAKIRWDLRRNFWFWAVIVLALALEMPLVLMIPWQHITINRITLLPIGVAALVITLGAVKFVEKFIVKYVPPDEEGGWL
jgi:hypothetical protein